MSSPRDKGTTNVNNGKSSKSNHHQQKNKVSPPNNTPFPTAENHHHSPPPPRISIENVDFILQDQKRKQEKLQSKMDRHKSKNRKARHIRNESFGKTPSICELGLDITDGGGAAADAAAPHNRDLWLGGSSEFNTNTNANQQQQQQQYQQYEVPLASSPNNNQPPPPAPNHYDPSTIDGYVPWPAQQQQVHPLKADHRNQQHQQQYQQAQPYPEILDDEYASLLQQNFSITSGYGSTNAAANVNVPGRHVPPTHPPPPAGAGRPRSGSSGGQFQHHKSSSLPSAYYPHQQQRSRAFSDGKNNSSQQHPQQQQQQQHQQQQYMMQQNSSEAGYRIRSAPQQGLRRNNTPPHIHRRSKSDNYGPGRNMMNQQQHNQQQQYLIHPQQQQHQQQQHPLLRNNHHHDRPPLNHHHHSPRLGGGGGSHSPGPPLPPSRKHFEYGSASGGAGGGGGKHHRRARSIGHMAGGGAGGDPTGGLRNTSTSPIPRRNSHSNLVMGSSMSSLGSHSGPRPPTPGGGGHHRRTSSLASSMSAGAVSVQSEASFMSVTSNIGKSSFYSGYNEATGNVEMLYPKENIHLSTNKELQTGWIYATELDNEVYEEYHLRAEEAMWEELNEQEDLYNIEYHRCSCQCPACYHGCTGDENNYKRRKPKNPFTALPPPTFAIAIEDNTYQKVLDEIGMRYRLPCGLFYCGHHEDVDRPNVMIAVLIVTLLFLGLGYAAYITAE